MSVAFRIRQTTAEDASALRALRLRALTDSPTAFGSDLSEDEAKPESIWAERCAPTPRSAIFVATEARGNRVGVRLIEAALDWARERGLRRASLSVETGNAPAISTYLKAGFTVYGVDREVLLIDGTFYDELLMAVWL